MHNNVRITTKLAQSKLRLHNRQLWFDVDGAAEDETWSVSEQAEENAEAEPLKIGKRCW